MSIRIVFLLDRSGSMHKIKASTISSFNQFLASQKAENAPGRVKFNLVQFNSKHETSPVEDIHQVTGLSDENFQPENRTALYDAMGATITELSQEIDQLPADQQPDSVIMVILTDGLENSSQTFTQDQVFSLVTERQNAGKWKFIYLGANQDAIKEAGKLGIGKDTSLDYGYSDEGVTSAMKATTQAVNFYSQGLEYSFDQDRDEAMDAGAAAGTKRTV